MRDVGAVEHERLPPAVNEKAADPGCREAALLPEVVGQDRVLDVLLDEWEGREKHDGNDK